MYSTPKTLVNRCVCPYVSHVQCIGIVRGDANECGDVSLSRQLLDEPRIH